MEAGFDGVPNIGPGLATALELIGVRSVGDLRAEGAIAVWERLCSAGLRDCDGAWLLDLEGAVAGVRWHRLPADVRRRLTEYVARRQR